MRQGGGWALNFKNYPRLRLYKNNWQRLFHCLKKKLYEFKITKIIFRNY